MRAGPTGVRGRTPHAAVEEEHLPGAPMSLLLVLLLASPLAAADDDVTTAADDVVAAVDDLRLALEDRGLELVDLLCDAHACEVTVATAEAETTVSIVAATGGDMRDIAVANGISDPME